MKPAMLLIFSLLAATFLRADTIFSTLGPGRSFTSTNSWPIVGPEGDKFAASFAPAQNFILESIDVAVVLFSGTDALTVEIDADNASAPGAPVETLDTSGLSGTPVVRTVDSVSHPMLLAGDTYWVVLSSGVSNSVGWNWNDQGYGGVSLLVPGSPFWLALGTDFPTPAFAVLGTVATITIPEPASIWLLLAALAAGISVCSTPWRGDRFGGVRCTKSKLVLS